MKEKNLFFLIILIFLMACDANDNLGINLTNTGLLGTWSITDLKIDNAVIIVTQSRQTYKVNATAIAKDYNTNTTFSENPDIFKVNGSLTLVVTASLFGLAETQEIRVNDLYGFNSGNWSLNNNIITLQKDNETIMLEVIYFEGNTLKLKTILDVKHTNGKESVFISGASFMTLKK